VVDEELTKADDFSNFQVLHGEKSNPPLDGNS
jgi:hypothetical protein